MLEIYGNPKSWMWEWEQRTDPGGEIKGGNKFETNLLPNMKIVNYNKLF